MANKDHYEPSSGTGVLKRKCEKYGGNAFEVFKIQKPTVRYRIQCLNPECKFAQLLGTGRRK
jgi:hypothetical protein